jgi:peptidoglycan/xylan/chitin deacetylase (PgdA/CDA1 family)
MRTDRLLSVALVAPVRRFALGTTPGVPILMYHELDHSVRSRHPYFETATSPDTFARHMRFLHDNRYETLTVQQAVECMNDGKGDRRRVAITFDDAYDNFYTAALPTLLDHGFTATVFVVSTFQNHRPLRFSDKHFMSWPQIRAAQASGVEIGSHSVSHPELWTLSRSELTYELVQSKATIEDAIGMRIHSFSHPFAFPEHDTAYIAQFSILMQEAGYAQGVSTIIGTAGPEHRPYALPRLPVNDHDDLEFFQAKLEGAYDWLHAAQSVYKRCFKNARSLVPGRKRFVI